MNTTISLTEQELAHVLAGLRHLHESIEKLMPAALADEYPQLEDVEILTQGAIDELCQRINCEDDKPRISINVQGGVVVGARANVDMVVCVFDEDSDFDSAEEFNQAKDEYESLPLGVY